MRCSTHYSTKMNPYTGEKTITTKTFCYVLACILGSRRAGQHADSRSVCPGWWQPRILLHSWLLIIRILHYFKQPANLLIITLLSCVDSRLAQIVAENILWINRVHRGFSFFIRNATLHQLSHRMNNTVRLEVKILNVAI